MYNGMIYTIEEYDNRIKELALVFAEEDGLIIKKFKFNHETKIKWRFLYVK